MRRIFEDFVKTESGTRLVQALRAEGATTKRGRPFTKSDVYRVLSNRTYLGEANHSLLPINQTLVELPTWGEGEILSRAAFLFERARQVWAR